MTAVYKRELRSYFTSMVGYVFIAILIFFVGIYFMAYNLFGGYPSFGYVLLSCTIIFMVAVPILTMRVIAEERRQKTDQLLYSLPVTTTQVVLGKYLALLAVYLVPLGIISTYPLIFSRYGEVYLPTSYGSLFAIFVMGAALIAVGVFLSSLTENQGMAAGITVAVILFNYYSVSLSEYVSTTILGTLAALVVLALILGGITGLVTGSDVMGYAVAFVLLGCICIIGFTDASVLEGLLPDLMRSLSLFERFNAFVSGVFDLTALVYYGSVILFFLFLTVQSLEKRRYN